LFAFVGNVIFGKFKFAFGGVAIFRPNKLGGGGGGGGHPFLFSLPCFFNLLCCFAFFRCECLLCAKLLVREVFVYFVFGGRLPLADVAGWCLRGLRHLFLVAFLFLFLRAIHFLLHTQGSCRPDPVLAVLTCLIWNGFGIVIRPELDGFFRCPVDVFRCVNNNLSWAVEWFTCLDKLAVRWDIFGKGVLFRAVDIQAWATFCNPQVHVVSLRDIGSNLEDIQCAILSNPGAINSNEITNFITFLEVSYGV
jgi:hypothetical protein